MAEKITVIGGSGFVGTHFCQQLISKQFDFEIVDLKLSNKFPEKCKIADVRDIESLRKTITGSIIVNLAAVHRDNVQDKSEYQRTNVIGAQNISKVCMERGIDKIIFTSSVAVYGFVESAKDETGAICPFNEYGRTKFDAEEVFRSWQSSGNNALIIVRPTVIFGEGNRGNVFNLINQIASGRFMMVGSGENKKSMAYVGNVVAFLEACVATKKTYGVYNYVDTPNITMSELVYIVRKKLNKNHNNKFKLPIFLGFFIGYIADAIGKITGKNLPISSIRVKKFISSTEFLSSKRELDAFEPPFDLTTALEKTLQSEFISPQKDQEIFFTE